MTTFTWQTPFQVVADWLMEHGLAVEFYNSGGVRQINAYLPGKAEPTLKEVKRGEGWNGEHAGLFLYPGPHGYWYWSVHNHLPSPRHSSTVLDGSMERGLLCLAQAELEMRPADVPPATELS